MRSVPLHCSTGVAPGLVRGFWPCAHLLGSAKHLAKPVFAADRGGLLDLVPHIASFLPLQAVGSLRQACRAFHGMAALLELATVARQPYPRQDLFQMAVTTQVQPTLTVGDARFLHRLPHLTGLRLRSPQSLHRLQGLASLRQLCISLNGSDMLDLEPVGAYMQGLTLLQLRCVKPGRFFNLASLAAQHSLEVFLLDARAGEELPVSLPQGIHSALAGMRQLHTLCIDGDFRPVDINAASQAHVTCLSVSVRALPVIPSFSGLQALRLLVYRSSVHLSPLSTLASLSALELIKGNVPLDPPELCSLAWLTRLSRLQHLSLCDFGCEDDVLGTQSIGLGQQPLTSLTSLTLRWPVMQPRSFRFCLFQCVSLRQLELGTAGDGEGPPCKMVLTADDLPHTAQPIRVLVEHDLDAVLMAGSVVAAAILQLVEVTELPDHISFGLVDW